jgi:hypothetical protein
MDRLGLLELIGRDHFHGTVTAAVESVAVPRQKEDLPPGSGAGR